MNPHSPGCDGGPDNAAPRLPPGARRTLLLAAFGPLAVAGILRLLNVPLGCPGRFVYLWSPIFERRIIAVPSAVLIGVGLAAATWLLGTSARKRGHRSPGPTPGEEREGAASSEYRPSQLPLLEGKGAGDIRPWHRPTGLGLATVATLALAIWSYRAPPQHLNQHVFNTFSPSQDGAFVAEAWRVKSVHEYLLGFPQRATTPPPIMRGTRVISNPPGTTLLAVVLRRVLERWPEIAELAAAPVRSEMTGGPIWDRVGPKVTLGLVFFWALTALWVLSTPFLYLTGRLYFPPATSLAYAVCCVFTPATLLLTPGKDPAQLLTAAVPLYFWLYAWRRGRWWAAVVAGAVFPIACLASLVHVWLAGIVVVATAWSACRRPGRLRDLVLRLVLPASVAAAATAAAVSLIGGVDWYRTLTAVARSQALVTRGPDAMPLVWQLLGVPLFLLFAGPALWTLTFWRPREAGEVPGARDDGRRLGGAVLLLSVTIMVATIGFTNAETPRLWIPFVPLLMLGLFLRRPALRRETRAATAVAAALVLMQIACAAAQWSLMDMREAETRLLEGRFFY